MLFVSTSLVYFLASLMLDPRSNFLTMRPQPSDSTIDAALDAANINDEEPLLARYLDWLGGIATDWDWGRSPAGQPVWDVLWHRIVVSVHLVSIAVVIAVVVGVALGVYTAKRKYQVVDRVATATSSFFLATPAFVLALLTVMVYLQLHERLGTNGLYVTGLGTGGLVDQAQHLLLPTVVLVCSTYYHYHLTQRTYLLDAINADYVRTARSKGVRRGPAIRRHALRMASVPTTFSVAASLTATVTGSLFVEIVFAVHGAGQFFVETLNTNDINGAVAVAFIAGVATCAGLLVADVAVALIDPRTRLG